MQSRGAAMICHADVSTGEGAMRGSAFGLAADIGANYRTLVPASINYFL
jgi:hypothetical protein